MTYDKLGRATRVTDPEGMETTFAYDMLSRKTEEVADAAAGGLAIKVTWLFDQWDATNGFYYEVVEAWEDGSTHQDTQYYYGSLKHPGAVTKTTYPDSGAVTVAYNDDGTVNTGTDQRGGRPPRASAGPAWSAPPASRMLTTRSGGRPR